MFVVDTNILLYAVNPDARHHQRARDMVNAWRLGHQLWFLTWGIIYEFLRVSTHRAVFPSPLTLPEARGWIESLQLGSSSRVLSETERHGEVLRALAARHPALAGNPVHDLHTAALMLEHGVMEIRTADADFHQFPFLRVVNPMVDAQAP